MQGLNIFLLIVVIALVILGAVHTISWGWAIGGIVIAVVLGLVAMYNGFVRLKNRTQEAWSDIDVQLKRRHDLIPNLVETVKGYAAHEKSTFEEVTQARANAISASQSGDIAQQGKAENMLSGALKSLFAVSENYPDLKANQNFLDLQRQLTDTEDKIQAARRFYNGNVRDFNMMIQSFPNNMMAGMFGFKAFAFFDLDGSPEERENVQVKF